MRYAPRYDQDDSFNAFLVVVTCLLHKFSFGFDKFENGHFSSFLIIEKNLYSDERRHIDLMRYRRFGKTFLFIRLFWCCFKIQIDLKCVSVYGRMADTV